MFLAPFSKPPQPAPEWRDGRQERTKGPADEGGPHRQAGTKWKTPKGLRHAAAGPQGSDAHPATPVPAGTRHRARAMTIKPEPCSGAHVM